MEKKRNSMLITTHPFNLSKPYELRFDKKQPYRTFFERNINISERSTIIHQKSYIPRFYITTTLVLKT